MGLEVKNTIGLIPQTSCNAAMTRDYSRAVVYFVLELEMPR